MIRSRAKSSLSKMLQEVHACAEQQERELAALRATVERLRVERDDLRIELLSRTSVPRERLDFCRDGEHGETTAVLPRPTWVRRLGGAGRS